MKVLVTGASGFIGKYVMRELVGRGWSGETFDAAADRVGAHSCDVLDPESIREAVQGSYAVIHLAGVLGTSELFEDAEQAIDVNILGTLNVLRACQEYGAKYVGITMPKVWPNVYQATKSCAFDLALAWREAYGLQVSHVRAYNVYGPGQKYGRPQKIIPTFATKAWRGEPLPIWGDGSQVVDLIHAEQVAKILVDAVPWDGWVFDAGTGTPTTVRDVALHVLGVAGSDAGLRYLPMRIGERPGGVVAKGEGWGQLGWQPSFSLPALDSTIQAYR